LPTFFIIEDIGWEREWEIWWTKGAILGGTEERQPAFGLGNWYCEGVIVLFAAVLMAVKQIETGNT
jgi:hypothetical protein